MADVIDSIYSIGGYLWVYKLQILGSFFIALSLFEYFYKQYLSARRKKIVKKIIKEYNDLIIEFKNMANNDNNLTPAYLDSKIEILATTVDAKLNVFGNKIEGFGDKLEAILVQTTKTNGRITALEDDKIPELEKRIDAELGVIRFLKKRKWLIGLLILGLYKFIELVDIQYLFKVLKGWIL